MRFVKCTQQGYGNLSSGEDVALFMIDWRSPHIVMNKLKTPVTVVTDFLLSPYINIP